MKSTLIWIFTANILFLSCSALGFFKKCTQRYQEMLCITGLQPFTVKFLFIWTLKNRCNYPKNWTMWLHHRVMRPKDADWIANCVDPDQTAPLGAVWYGFTLFAQGYLPQNLGSYGAQGYLSENLGSFTVVFIFCSSDFDFIPKYNLN